MRECARASKQTFLLHAIWAVLNVVGGFSMSRCGGSEPASDFLKHVHTHTHEQQFLAACPQHCQLAQSQLYRGCRWRLAVRLAGQLWRTAEALRRAASVWCFRSFSVRGSALRLLETIQ